MIVADVDNNCVVYDVIDGRNFFGSMSRYKELTPAVRRVALTLPRPVAPWEALRVVSVVSCDCVPRDCFATGKIKYKYLLQEYVIY